MGRPKKVIIPLQKILTFEDCYEEILRIVESRKFKWHLDAIKGWYEWEDVRSHLLAHIAKKWYLFDQSKKLSSWVLVVVNNQQINLLRNFYMSHAPPCVALKCPEYEGNNMCHKYGSCNARCDLYAHWIKGKRAKHQIQLPLSMEHHSNEVLEMQSQNIDIEKTGNNLHEKMKTILKPLEWIVYYNLFVLHKSEEDVGKMLKLKSSEGRNPGYARVNQIKKLIMIQVRKVLQDGDVEIIGDNNV